MPSYYNNKKNLVLSPYWYKLGNEATLCYNCAAVSKVHWLYWSHSEYWRWMLKLAGVNSDPSKSGGATALPATMVVMPLVHYYAFKWYFRRNTSTGWGIGSPCMLGCHQVEAGRRSNPYWPLISNDMSSVAINRSVYLHFFTLHWTIQSKHWQKFSELSL